MDTHQSHDAQPVPVHVAGRAVRAPAGRGAAAAGRGGARGGQGPAERGRDGAHGAEPARCLQAAAAHTALDLLCALLRVLLLLLDQPEGKDRLRATQQGPYKQSGGTERSST